MKSGKKRDQPVRPLAKGVYRLEKYPGKGGWTYISLPRPRDLSKTPFGNRRVRGCIDDFQFSGLSIWSAKNNTLFFPVKAAIRKILGKGEGDEVRVVIFDDNDEPALPDDFRQVLDDEPPARKKFMALTAGERREMISRITEAKRDSTRVNRMAEALRSLARN